MMLQNDVQKNMLRESSSNSFYVFNKTLMKREVVGEADKEREKNREKEER